MSCRAPAGPGATEDSALPKLVLPGDMDGVLSLVLPKASWTEGAAILLPGEEQRCPKILDVNFLAAAAQVLHPIALPSGVSGVFSLKKFHPVETAQELSPFVLECQPQAWHQLVFASSRCDSTAWSWSILCSKGSVLERLAYVMWNIGMCWEPSCASWSIPCPGIHLWKGQHISGEHWDVLGAILALCVGLLIAAAHVELFPLLWFFIYGVCASSGHFQAWNSYVANLIFPQCDP